MNRVRARLIRLEQQPSESPLTFVQILERYERMFEWLKERGFADSLAAIEAGESGPPGYEDLLCKDAGYDIARQAFARIEKALNAGQLPDDADFAALKSGAATH